MSVRSIVSEIQRIRSQNSLLKIIRACREQEWEIQKKDYEKDVRQFWQGLEGHLENGALLVVASDKVRKADPVKTGDILKVLRVRNKKISVRNRRTGARFILTLPEMHRFGLTPKDSPTPPKDLQEESTEKPEEEPVSGGGEMPPKEKKKAKGAAQKAKAGAEGEGS